MFTLLLKLPKVLVRKIFSHADHMTFCIAPSYFYLWMNYGKDVFVKGARQIEWSNFINRAIENFKFESYSTYRQVRAIMSAYQNYHLDMDHLSTYNSPTFLYVTTKEYMIGSLVLKTIIIKLISGKSEQYQSTGKIHKCVMYGSKKIKMSEQIESEYNIDECVDYHGPSFIRLIYKLYKNEGLRPEYFNLQTFQHIE
jgi:hypothetical protein